MIDRTLSGFCLLATLACASPPDDDVVNSSIWGSSDGTLLVAGYRSGCGCTGEPGFVKELRGNGTTATHDTDIELWGIWGPSAADYFVAGGFGTVQRRTDGAWQSWDIWSLWEENPESFTIGIWGSASNDVFTVGHGGAIAHFDGSEWAAMETPTSADLVAVWGSSATDVWAVGANGTFLHYDGVAWIEAASPTTAYLNDVWGSSPADVFAVGSPEPEQTHVILHFDGVAWTVQHEGEQALLGIHGTGPDRVYAVGGQRTGDSIRSAIWHFDGSEWVALRDGSSTFLWDVWVTPAGDVYAVGPEDTLVHRSF